MRDWVVDLEKVIKKDEFWKVGDVGILRTFQVIKEEYKYTLAPIFLWGIDEADILNPGDSEKDEFVIAYKNKKRFVDETRESIFVAGDFLDSLNHDLKKVQGEEKDLLLRRAVNICQQFEAAVKCIEDALKEIMLYPSL